MLVVELSVVLGLEGPKEGTLAFRKDIDEVWMML